MQDDLDLEGEEQESTEPGSEPEPDSNTREEPAPGARPRFADIIGQDRVLHLLLLEIIASKRENRRLADIALIGPAGLGKSLIAEATANEAELAVYPASGPELSNQEAALRVLRGCGILNEQTSQPVGLIIDEADLISRAASYMLHGPMTTGAVFWGGQVYVIPQGLTILATTNRISGIPIALRSRFAETIHIDFYDVQALEAIAVREAARRGIVLADGVAAFLARNAAGEPRKIGHLLRSLNNILDGQAATLEIAVDAMRLSGLYSGGLSHQQYKYLKFLSESDKGTAGIASLAAYLATDRWDLTYGTEPYLLRSRLVDVTAQGRRITPAGREYLREAW